MGGAQAVAALAYGTETIAARRRDRRARATSGCTRPSARSSAGSASTASPGRSELVVVADDARGRRAGRARSAGPGRARARTALVVAVRAAAPLEQVAERSRLAPDTGAGRACCRSDDLERRARARRGARARAPPARRARRPRRWRRRVRRAGCVFVGAASGTAFGDYVAGSNHVLPTGGAARFASGLSPAHFRRRMAEVRIGARGRARWPAPARRSRAPRASRRTPSRWRPASRRIGRHEPPHREIERSTGETDVRLALALDGTGAGERADRRRASSTTCSTCSPATARLDLDVAATRRPRDRRPPHRGGRRDRARPGARRGARRPQRDLPLRPRDRPHGRGARDLRDRHLRARPSAPVRGATCRPARSRGFDHELAEEFFRAVADATRKLTLHLDASRPAPTRTT